MKTTSKHNEVRLTGSEPDKTHDLQTAGRRQSLLTLFALAITAGCSSGGSSSVRDTNPAVIASANSANKLCLLPAV